MLVSVRNKQTKRVFISHIMSAFLGPTYVTQWIMRQAKHAGYDEGGYESQVGEKGVWSS